MVLAFFTCNLALVVE